MSKGVALWGLSLLSFALFAQEDDAALNAITVIGDREEMRAAETGFEVNNIDVEDYKNASTDVNRLIRSSPGIVIRERGGLGSTFQLYINGLSDKQIRYFVDGVPMENFGSALSLDNFPVNLINGIEVFKGVVPTSLSADALGGAINIITPAPGEELLDVSYSYGSFNTQRAALVAQSMQGNHFYYRLSSFYNHSDNDYWMDEVPSVDELGNIRGNMRAKRFHDAYTSRMVSLKTGLMDTRFADDLALTLTYAGNDNEVQHPDTSINQVLGGYHTENETRLASIRYKKAWDRFSLSAYLLSGRIDETINDTLDRDYDWSGNYTPKVANSGEWWSNKTLFHLKDKQQAANLFAEYQFNDDARISLSWAANRLERVGREELNLLNRRFEMPNKLSKQVLALNYGFDALNDRLRGNLFVKRYDFDAEVIAPAETASQSLLFVTDVEQDDTGYGATMKYALRDHIDIKASYEFAVRMPEADEILGDGQWIYSNPILEHETSHNLNLGLQHRLNASRFQLTSDVNLFSRDASDFIQLPPESAGGPFDNYVNYKEVRIRGIEVASSLVADDRYILQANATWQDMRDISEEGTDNKPNDHKGDRLPNAPYLFANLRAGTWKDIRDKDRFSAFWAVNYVHEYFHYWESLGNRNTKHTIPTQLTHDIDLEYAFDYGTYNFSLSVRNIFDKAVFDNRAIQKPGRGFFVKLRYVY